MVDGTVRRGPGWDFGAVRLTSICGPHSPRDFRARIIAAIHGDEDGKVYAADFAEVFEAAGWGHPETAYRRWDRDPVGVEITLNESDGRARRVNVAVGALINITRKLSLTDSNTIYMNGDVPAGQVQIKIGKNCRGRPIPPALSRSIAVAASVAPIASTRVEYSD